MNPEPSEKMLTVAAVEDVMLSVDALEKFSIYRIKSNCTSWSLNHVNHDVQKTNAKLSNRVALKRINIEVLKSKINVSEKLFKNI